MGLQADKIVPLSLPKQIAGIYTPALILGR